MIRRVSRALLAICLVLVPAAGRAQDSGTPPPRHTLGEHVFIPRNEVVDPFTTSYVASTSGFARGSATGPTFDLNGQPVNLADYEIIAYSQLFSGQWGITDWLALRIRASGTFYGGANGSAAAGIGVNAIIRAGIGTTMSWQLAPNFRLGALVDLGFGPSVGIDILDSIRQSIAEGSVQTPVNSSSSTVLTPAVSAAWTVTRGLGAVFNLSYTHNAVRADESSGGTDVLAGQAALDLDLRELGSIPLGLAVSYSAGYSVGDERFRRWVLGGGIFYTGRQALTLGLELAYRRAPLGTHDVFVSSTYALFSLRYNFD